MRSVPRGWRDAAAAILFAALAAEVGRAATFEPEVHADLGHSEDAYYVAVEPRPDWFAVFALVLPLRGEGQRNRWELSYRPSAFRYRDLSELDHYEHRVRVGAESIARRETSFAIEAGWARSQEQGNATSVLAGDLFLVPRSELEALSFGASLRREQGARFVWNVEARGADADYSPIPDAETEPPSAILEDRREYELVAGFGRLVSRAAEVGLEYRYRRYDLDVTGEENDHLVSVTASRRLSERTAVEGRVGAFRRDLASPPAVEAPGDALAEIRAPLAAWIVEAREIALPDREELGIDRRDLLPAVDVEKDRRVGDLHRQHLVHDLRHRHCIRATGLGDLGISRSRHGRRPGRRFRGLAGAVAESAEQNGREGPLQ